MKVKKNLIKSQAQFQEKLRKLRLRQIDVFLIKRDVYTAAVSKVIFLLYTNVRMEYF